MEPSKVRHPRDPAATTPKPSITSSIPKPTTYKRITKWIQTTAAMSTPPSESGSLSESAYEFIDTDVDSRDDNATESVASTDEQPNDLASLNDTENSGEESEDDNQEGSSIPALLGQSIGNAFSTPTIGRSSAVLHDDIEKPMAHSIEFEEPISLGAETVSVKHTVADFDEEQTASTIKGMQLQNPPKRLVVTIRQTMTKQVLSTRDPLRILYVGSHSAKQDIIHKIASSVTASATNDKHAHYLRHSSSQLYNVVPVSAFGSERTPEIELMHSSGYQINVEDCISAEALHYEATPEKAEVIRLTLDDNFSYHSVPENKGFIVSPKWELPHVAVFYCSDSDDAEARRTRTIARKFMTRHAIPSIVISHRQLFSKGQCMALDQHSIHMCLESRDPEGRGNVIFQRLPIDLASFLNIDARQMNRNLAYLTGLHDPPKVLASAVAGKKVRDEIVNPQDLEKTRYNVSEGISFLRNRTGAEWRALLPVGLLLLSIFGALFTGIPSYRSSTTPSISINSKVMSTIPISTTTDVVESATAPLAVEASTRTVKVTQSHTTEPNSLALLPSMELGKLSRALDSQSKPVNKSLVCTAEILGGTEILIRIPSTTKLSWLTHEAMSVNITRGNDTVDTERASSCDDGIVLLLSKKDAYGVLNISIVTTKKPRINETFQVDFGMTVMQTMQAFSNRLYPFSLFDSDLRAEVDAAFKEYISTAHKSTEFILADLSSFREIVETHASSMVGRISEFANSASLGAAKRSAIISKEAKIQLAGAEETLTRRLQTLQHLREPLSNGLLRAQVRSKLLWLKLQGKDVEYTEYKERASEVMFQKASGPQTCSKGSPGQQKRTPLGAKVAAAKRATDRKTCAGKKAGKKARRLHT